MYKNHLRLVVKSHSAKSSFILLEVNLLMAFSIDSVCPYFWGYTPYIEDAFLVGGMHPQRGTAPSNLAISLKQLCCDMADTTYK